MINKKIPLAAVLGHPVAHSKSPKMHMQWLKQTDTSGHYIPIDVSSDNFEDVVRSMIKMGFVGANVTIPHKEKAILVADMVSDRASIIGAANTLTFRDDGTIFADNTDGYGFLQNIKTTCPEWSSKDGPALILGAGGAARAIICALLDDGIPEIFLSNRTRARADQLKSIFGAKIKVVDWVKVGNYVQKAATLVNTTSLGMVGKPELTIPLDGLCPETLVTDIVYTPLETPLLKKARSVGCQTVDGLGMLIHQGTPAFERWFGKTPKITDELRELLLKS